MKAYRFIESGLDNLKCLDEPIAALGHGEVQLKVKAASLNYRDIGVAMGQYPAAPKLIPLSDGSGVIEAVGSSVEEFEVGDQVVSCFYEDWPSGRASSWNHRRSFGSERDGLLAEYVNIPASGIISKPQTLDHIQASTLTCAATTAWSALFREGRLKAGEHVVIEGTGGVAIFALQFAKMAGATVTILSSSDAKLDRARELGADNLVNYRTTPIWSEAVLDCTKGFGADIVVELGGTDTLGQALKSIRVDGLVAVIGVLSGIEAGLFLPDVLRKHARLQGITVGHRADMIAMCKAIDNANLKPIVNSCYAFDNAIEAYNDLPKGEHFGKIVIDFAR